MLVGMNDQCATDRGLGAERFGPLAVHDGGVVQEQTVRVLGGGSAN